MEKEKLKKAIELLVFFSDRPITCAQIKSILKSAEDYAAADDDITAAIDEISKEYREREAPMIISVIGGGYQFVSRPEYSACLKRLYRDRTTFKLSVSAMETLSIIAYKQPITRAEIEEIRGVETTAVLDTLFERKLIRIAGRRETLGRPLLYGTTQDFMRYFGLGSLNELPSLETAVKAEADGSNAEGTVDNVEVVENKNDEKQESVKNTDSREGEVVYA